ncbi:MAG TPA: hypothetical protein VLM40_18180 [Gemmata sp.]|nr:hypothetical protein [Gemmata sp.]
MREAIYAALQQVRSRLQTQFALRCIVAGLIAGAVGGLALGASRLAFGLDISWVYGAAAVIVGPVLGLVVGISLRRGWHDAAQAIDVHYGLKDRAVTALAFSDQASPTDLHSIQISDALGHMNAVQPRVVVPLTVPRAWPVALALLVIATAALAWPLPDREVQAGPPPVPENIAAFAADQKTKNDLLEKKLAETSQDLEDDNADDIKKGIKELLSKFEQKLEELNQPGIDEKEALAKLSELQADMQALSNQLNVAAMEGQLSSLGTALAASQPFEGAGKALQDGKLEKAAKELEQIDAVELTPKEAKALEEKLKQLSKQMGEAGQGSLSEAVAELADSIGGGKGKVGKATKNLAKKVNNAVKRRKINELLTAANEDLKEGKCNCQANGGLKIKQPQKSNSPSSTWGRGVSGNTEGEKTRLNGTRNQLQITGTPGEQGDSDVETTATPEARQKASREYKEKYEKFRRASETVIDGEPIPLGHRQTVKKYFELIRPSNSDTPPQK